MGQTFTEKILQKHAVNINNTEKVKSGDSLWLYPEHILTHDNTSAVIPKFNELNCDKIFNNNQPVLALDHNIQDQSDLNLSKYKFIEHFSKKHNLKYFPPGRGIGHQIMIEEGFAFPGKLSVASDSHANMYGGLGCLGIPIVRSDAAGIWATGKFWFKIPPILNIILINKPNHQITGKDIILTLISNIDRSVVLNKCLEFSGNGIQHISIDDRLTIANMTTEWGAQSALFPIDKITIKWIIENLNNSVNKSSISKCIENFNSNNLKMDKNAFFEKAITIDLSSIQTSITECNSLDQLLNKESNNAKPIKIDKAFLLSCANSRASDLRKAADKLKGRTVSSHVKLYVSAASEKVMMELKKSNHWNQFINSGAIILPSGCGPCIGLGEGVLKKGEVAISSTNRNFSGRMGDIDSKAYLSTPEIVAEAAIDGYRNISDIALDPKITYNFNTIKKYNENSNKKSIISNLSGHLLLCPNSNITTDDIYPSKYTYDDSIDVEKMAQYAMKNYDLNFSTLCQEGDILLAGANFGIGSSREQSITSLKSKGIVLIIACSYSATFKRNAFNSGFGLIECPELFDFMLNKFDRSVKTIITNKSVNVDFEHGTINLDNSSNLFSFEVWQALEQNLVSCGGLNNYLIDNK